MIQIVEKLKKTLWNMPGRCFSKVPSIRPDFPNWYRECYEEKERERGRAVPDPTRLSKASTLLVAASLVLGIPSSREVYIRTTTTPLRVRERDS